MITSDIDPIDAPFIESSERTPEGFYRTKAGIDQAIARGLAYAPYADRFGVKHLSQTLKKPANLLKPSMLSILVNCLLITVHRPLIGKLN